MSQHVFEKNPSQLKMIPKDRDVDSESCDVTCAEFGCQKSLHDRIFVNDPNKHMCMPSNQNKPIWVLTGVALVFLCSTFTFVIMWYTNIFNTTLMSTRILSNESQAFEWWRRPPVKPVIKVHIFNYTNVVRWQNKLDRKLKVEDIGPYVYQETLERINPQFNKDGTLTYQERRKYHFVPEKSIGRQFDQLQVPNLPFLTAVAMFKEINIFGRLTLNTFFRANNVGPFKVLAAHKFLWGYDDKLYDIAKPFMSFNGPLPFKKFGVLANRNGTQQDEITIHTGQRDLSQIGIISKYNGQSKIQHWGTEECNRIDGTDGSAFPPSMMDKDQTLYIYNNIMCRRFPIVFKEEVMVMNDIPAWRYKAPDDVFAHPDENPSNQCYCHMDSGACPPAGLFNVTPCAYGAPVFASFPHFYQGAPELISALEGINPDPEKHSTYIDLHPRLGFPLAGASRIQVNIQVQKSSGISGIDRFENNMYLPVVWLELTVDEDDLPQEIRTMIYHSSFSANAIQMGLRYGSLLTCLGSLALLVALLMRRRSRYNIDLTKDRTLQRNVSGEDKLMENF